MADDALCWMPATELAAAIRERRLSPVELVEAVLARIDRLNARLRAYLTVAEAQARQAAREAEAAVMRGDSLGPLHGVPVAIKDLSYTKGIRTTRGSLLYQDFVPDENHPIVERLLAAGATIVGKTNTPEFGWKGATDNRLGPPCVNPWDSERTPGGSSGGSAVAVASGMAPLATGSDGVCSIRTPASFCGIFGLKPQYGRIPSPTVGLDVAHLGPMTRTVRDAALMLNAMAGPHEADRQSLPASGVDYLAACDGGITGLRVAWSADLGYMVVDPEVRAIATAAAQRFAGLGCTLEETQPGFADPRHAIDVLFHGLLAGRYAAPLAAQRDRFDPALAATLDRYRDLGVGEIMQAQTEREQLWHRAYAFSPETPPPTPPRRGEGSNRLPFPCREGVGGGVFPCETRERISPELWQQMWPFFEKYDLLLTPTVACPPFALNRFGPETIDGQHVEGWAWTAATYPFNLTGQPAATVPCGFTASGLPVGLQIVGRRYDEATVLRASAAFELAYPWANRIPPEARERGNDENSL